MIWARWATSPTGTSVMANPANGTRLSRTEIFVTGLAALFLFALPLPHAIALRQVAFTIAFWTMVFALRGFATIPFRQLALTKPFIAWAILATASLAWAVNPAYSLGEIKSEVVYSAVAFLFFYAITRNALQLRIFLWALIAALVAGAASAVIGWYRTGSITEATLLYNGVGSYSTFLVALFPFLALTWISTGVWRTRIALALLTPLVFAPLWMSFTRNAWFAIGISLFLLLILMVGKSHVRHMRARLVIALVLVGTFTPLLLLNVLANRLGVEPSLGPVALATAGNDPRPALWTFVAERIAERPWTGYGFGVRTFNYAFPQIAEQNNVLWHTHNLILEYGFQLGVLGIAVLAWIFVAITREFWRLYESNERRTSLLGAAGIALVAGVLAKSMTDIFFYRENALLFWSLAGIALGYARHQTRRSP